MQTWRRPVAWFAGALLVLGAVTLASAPADADATTPTADSQSVTTPENQTATITLHGSDESETATYTIVDQPTHGTIYNESPEDIVYGAPPQADYEPDTGYSGPDSFSFTIADDGGTSQPATVSITVQAPPTCGVSTAPTRDAIASGDVLKGTKLAASHLTTHAGGELLVAYVEATGTQTREQVITAVSGAGLTWRHQGLAEGDQAIGVYYARTSGVLRNATITATLQYGGQAGSIVVVGYKHAKGLGSGVDESAPTGPPHTYVVSQCEQSIVAAAGISTGSTTPAQAVPGQTITHQHVDAKHQAAFWMQSVDTPTAAPGMLVNVDDTAPVGQRYGLFAIEIRGTTYGIGPAE